MNLYTVHNFPAFNLELNLQFSNALEGQYLVESKHGMYTVLPTEHDIHICMANQYNLSMMNQMLYQVKHTEWCT